MSESPPPYADLVGVQSAPLRATEPVEAGAVRRFTQAIMDPDPAYWDAEYAGRSRIGALVAPPLYVNHVQRRPPGTPDPFERYADEPDLDGTDGSFARAGADITWGRALPPVDSPHARVLNGGIEAEFFSLPEHGDVVVSTSRYVEIREREGRSGSMLFVVTETTSTTEDGRPLATVHNTAIRR